MLYQIAILMSLQTIHLIRYAWVNYEENSANITGGKMPEIIYSISLNA